jgi:hypothetical protein
VIVSLARDGDAAIGESKRKANGFKTAGAKLHTLFMQLGLNSYVSLKLFHSNPNIHIHVPRPLSKAAGF